MTARSSEAPPSGRSALLSVGAGLAVFGLATYGFLAFAGRGMPAEDFAPLSVMWTLLNAVGIGLFVPFEQELARRTAVARATRTTNLPAVRRTLIAGGAVIGALAVMAGLLGTTLAERLFAGRTALVGYLVAALVGMAVSYVVRGLLSGNGRFGHYGAQLAVDGVLRVVGAAVLVSVGVAGPEPYAAVLVVSPVAAVLVTTPRFRRLVVHGSRPELLGGAMALTTLVAASVVSQALANAGPVIVQLLAAPDEATAAGLFTAALVVARIPLFAFAAVQSLLLPGLAGFVGSRDPAGLRARIGVVAAWTGALGALGTLVIWLLGPWLVPLLFGEDFAVGRGVITAIAASGALFMLAQVAAQLLYALGHEWEAVAGWASGLVVLVAACAWHASIDVRAAGALVAGAGAALVVLAYFAVARLRRWSREIVGERVGAT